MAETQTKEKNAEDKVSLDTEGAAFLSGDALTDLDTGALDHKKNDSLPAVGEDDKLEIPDQDRKKGRKKKLIILGGVAALVVVLAVGLGVWLFSGGEEQAAGVPPSPPEETVGPKVVVVPDQDSGKPAGPQEFVVKFGPFRLMFEEEGKAPVFLQCRFTAITKKADLVPELEASRIILRDAIYFYLKNRTAEFLLDHNNVDQIKKDIADVMQGYLRTGAVEEMLFESFLSG